MIPAEQRLAKSMWLQTQKETLFKSVLMRWMNLEPIKHSEVSQKEKNECCALMHLCGI